MQLSFKNAKKYFSLKQWMLRWYRSYKILFFSGFMVVFGLGAYFWYNNLYQYRWSAERKKEFIETHFKATVFKEKPFQQLVSDFKERANRHEGTPPLTRDIFLGKNLE